MKTTIEFSVNLTCQKCVRKTEAVLANIDGIDAFTVDLENQRLLVETTLTTGKVQQLIESTGKTAVAVGFGGRGHLGAAVAAVGGPLGADGLVQGVVRFVQLDEHSCLVDGVLDGLTPGGEHAIAIHERGDLSAGCESLGGHFNPRGVRHGSPNDNEDMRHVGDLGNVRADDRGRAEFRFSDRLVKVWDIIGRSVVVASDKDDFGIGEQARSLVDGNCGRRISCGIIARSAGVFENSAKKICACDGVAIWEERNVPAAGKARQQRPQEQANL